MEKVYILYECDAWHTYSSMTADNIVGVATDEEQVKKLIEERLRNGHKDDIEEAVADGEYESLDDFIEQALEDFDYNNSQTQTLSGYIGVEFYCEEMDTNTLIL